MTIAAVAGTPCSLLGEGALWCARSRCLWWVDIRAPEVLALEPATGAVRRWPMPDLVAGIALRQRGGFVVALRHSLHAFDPETGLGRALVHMETNLPQNRLNEMRCDRTGVLWCGSMVDFGAEIGGSLYRIGADLEATPVRTRVRIPNALAFSRDGNRMHFADTDTGYIDCAELSGKFDPSKTWRRFVDASAAPGRPDGAMIDAEDHLWSARIGGGCLARFDPQGRLERIVSLPTSKPTSCAFGGDDLRTLYVTTARQGLSASELAAEPLAGRLLSLRPGMVGLPDHAFSG